MLRFRLDEGLPVEKPGAEPKYQKLFPLGVVKHRADFPKGKIDFSADFLGAMAANFKALKSATGHELQVNFNHIGGVDVDPRAPVESTVAAGWIRDVELRD